MFGYSLSAHNYNDTFSKIFVGAPKNGASGSVFTCDVTSKQCTPTTILNDIPNNHWDNNVDGLFGASITHDINGYILLCQPRYGRMYHCESENSSVEKGTCRKYTDTGWWQLY